MFSDKELATLLAALYLYEQLGMCERSRRFAEVNHIATGDGKFEALTAVELKEMIVSLQTPFTEGEANG